MKAILTFFGTGGAIHSGPPFRSGGDYLVGGDWNMNGLWLSISYMECHHPKWLSLHHFYSFFRGVGQPPTVVEFLRIISNGECLEMGVPGCHCCAMAPFHGDDHPWDFNRGYFQTYPSAFGEFGDLKTRMWLRSSLQSDRFTCFTFTVQWSSLSQFEPRKGIRGSWVFQLSLRWLWPCPWRRRQSFRRCTADLLGLGWHWL